MKKIMFLTMSILILLFGMSVVCADSDDASASAVTGGGSVGSISSSIKLEPSADIGVLQDPTQKIIGAIQLVGYLIAAGMIVYIGVKYIMASASEKADLKGLAVKYVIGAVLIVFGTTIAGWIFSIK